MRFSALIVTLGSLALAASAGTAEAVNLALGRPISSTSTYSGTFAPSKAVDGVTSDVQGNQWLGADGVTAASLTLTLDNPSKISQFRLLNTGNDIYLDRATGNFSIEVAGLNGVFSPAVPSTALQFHTAGFQTQPVSLNEVKFVRYNMLSIADPPGNIVGAAGGGLNELEVEGMVVATNVALGKPASATSTYSPAFGPDKAVNGVNNDIQGNQWLAADGVTSASLTVDLLDVYDVTTLALLNTGNEGYLDRATGNFSIDVAGENGVFYNAVSSTTLQAFTSGLQYQDVDLKRVRFVRFNMLSIVDPDGGGPFPLAGGGLNELQVFGALSVPEPASVLLLGLGAAALVRRRRTA